MNLQGAVRIDAPDSKNAFDLVERLEERLGHPRNTAYRLSYSINTEAIGVGITPENATTRYNLRGRVNWALHDTQNAVILQGTAASFTSWSATGSTVSILAAERDAAYRLMRILADQIVTRILTKIPAVP